MSVVAARPNTLAIVAAALIAGPFVAGDAVWLDTSVIIGTHALIALSVGLCYGQAGILSMAQAAFAAVGAYATGIATVKLGISPAIGLVVAILLPASLGYALARLVARLAPLAVALATLALGSLIEIVLRSWDDLTGGYIGLAGIPGLGPIRTPLHYFILTWAFVCLAVLLCENVARSVHGRALATIRHDRTRAMADGVPVPHLLSAAFALSAAIAGAAGWLYAHYLTYLSPGSLGTHLSISVLLMVVVGGTGQVLGPVVGAVVLSVLTRLLPAAEVQGLFFGGALVLILLLARQGLLGALLPLFAPRKA